MAPQVNWSGTHDQLLELTAAVNRNCDCAAHSHDVPRPVCGAHRMLWQDQRALDGLLFAQHIAERLRVEEFLAAAPTSMSQRQLPGQRQSEYRRQRRYRMSIVMGVLLVALGLGALILQYAWLLFGVSRGCLTRPAGIDCFALTAPNLVLIWPIVGLLLLTCGGSLIGTEYFAGRSPAQKPAVPTTRAVRDHQPSGSRTFAS